MVDLSILLQTASTVIASWTPKVVGSVAVLAFGWIVAGWAKKALYASRINVMLSIPMLFFMAAASHF